MRDFNWKPVGKFAKEVCNVLAFGAVMMLMRGNDVKTFSNHDYAIGTFDGAVSAIMRSDMFSHDKEKAITALKRNGDMTYYKAVIHVANDEDTYSHNKVDMIQSLSNG